MLRGHAQPEERTAILVTLVDACGLVKVLVPADERKAAEERARSLDVAEDAPGAVRDVIRIIQSQVGQTVTVTANPPG